jgi:hypothetical protein
MFHIVAREGVNSLVCEMKSDLADSLGSEANHTVDDTPGVEAFVASNLLNLFQKLE